MQWQSNSAAKNQTNRRVHLGERADCYYEAVAAGLMGRTIIGERCFDICKTIDMLGEHFGSVCDMDKIVITGNSGEEQRLLRCLL